ncbi:hypothetical protein OH491_24180 [Termitidicoccus mucosus]|uniref:TraG P-loop domain-containing protein n=1 Tax=Termitidicoccus mucosus TaxID=1184151 RepID=A0A178IQE4_9BACT|nr:hypothetical protein AW736_02275 [Opitutaceae bacterium TSB47]
MKIASNALPLSQYAPVGSGLPGGTARLDAYEDFAPQFPVAHLDEIRGDGTLSPVEDLDTRGVVVSQDFALGGGFFIESPDLRYYAQEAADTVHRGLAAAIGMLRKGERLQFVWMPQDVMDPLYEGYGARPDDPPFVAYARARRLADYQRRFATGQLRHFLSMCFLQTPYEGRVCDVSRRGLASRVLGGLSDVMGSGLPLARTVFRSTERLDLLRQMGAWGARVSQMERAFGKVRGLATRPVHSTDYIRLWRRLLSPDLWERLRFESGAVQGLYSNLGSTASVAAQCVTGRITDAGAYFTTGWYYHRILTLEVPPAFVEMGYLMTAFTRSEVLGAVRNFQLALNLTPRDKTRDKVVLKKKRGLVLAQYRDDPMKHPELEVQLAQINAQLSALENDDVSSLFSATLTVHLWSRDPADLVASEEVIIAQVRSITTMVLGGESLAAFPYFLSYCLPGCPGRGDAHRVVALTNEEAAPLVPLLGQGTGVLAKVREPAVPALFETALGTPFALDFFARRRVPMYGGVTVGGSGSGKSFLFNYLISSYCNRRTRVLVVDAAVGTPSFKTACAVLGGAYVEKDFCFNALGTKVTNGQVQPPDEEDLKLQLATLEAILQGGADARPLGNEQRAFLTESINYLFANPPASGVPYLRDLPQAMRNCVQGRPESSGYVRMADDWSQVLSSSWTFPDGANMNARYVDGPDDFPRAWLTVFDLKWVLDREDLLTVFMTLIFRHLSQITARNSTLPDHEREHVLVIFDEAWKVLFRKAFAENVLGLYKAARSRDVSLHLLTQDFSDLINFVSRMTGSMSAAKTSPIITQSSHFFFANIDAKEAELIGDTLNLTVDQCRMLPALAREDGKFAEYGYFCRLMDQPELLFSRLRYAPLPEELWAFSSSSDDDGRRIRVLAEVRDELRQPGARGRLIAGMVAKGWSQAGLSRLDDLALARHVMIYRLALDGSR